MVSFRTLILATLLGNVACKECKEAEMIYNGNFSQPKLFAPWMIVGSLDGGQGVWASVPDNNGFSIWQQGVGGCPPTDSTGAETGQSLQINAEENQWAQISYQFDLPCLLESSIATYSFDYWFKPSYVASNFRFSVEQQGCKLVQETYLRTSDEWTNVYGTFMVEPCQSLKISFTSNGEYDSGVRIDNISMKVKVCEGVEMVIGGDFSTPEVCNQWDTVQSLPSGVGLWQSTPGYSGFVLWREGAMGIPALNSIGVYVGQTLEINALSPKAQVGYQFFVPFLLGVAETTISFEFWLRSVEVVNYFGISVEQRGGVVLQKSLTSSFESGGGWVYNKYTVDLQPAAVVRLLFFNRYYINRRCVHKQRIYNYNRASCLIAFLPESVANLRS
eukprot:TRINITY_DN36272_c0_g1_i2.p1 TRINITY_DN36272_c0_g1~~TRINITY_DN36272_c0_g1_i2.p1  ORF type:complete len:388 (+),score=29.33 TRINITY_DN36272_c0_g1_i2:492-1655(+)